MPMTPDGGRCPPSGKRIGVPGPGNNRGLRVIAYEEASAIMEYLSIVDQQAWAPYSLCFSHGCRVLRHSIWFGRVSRLPGAQSPFLKRKNHDSRTIPLLSRWKTLAKQGEGTSDAFVFPKKDGEPYSEAPSASLHGWKWHLTMAEPSGTGSHFIQSGTTVATMIAQRLGPRDLMDVMGWRTFRWPCVMSTVMKTSDKARFHAWDGTGGGKGPSVQTR